MNKVIKRIILAFDRFEDNNRFFFSKHSLLYALIAGFAIVLFWRGVWHFADLFEFLTPLMSILISVAVMLATGTFVSFFVGDQIIRSGLKEENRIDQKTERDIRKEDADIQKTRKQIAEVKKIVTGIETKLKKPRKRKKAMSI